jgi:hypothetical protein
MAFREGGRQHNNYKYKPTHLFLSSHTSTCTDTAGYARLPAPQLRGPGPVAGHLSRPAGDHR